ncbi:hypothetical protein [Metabacillus litoralis]|nr:hypothetical protein [Metabacillus litoralis]
MLINESQFSYKKLRTSLTILNTVLISSGVLKQQSMQKQPFLIAKT